MTTPEYAQRFISTAGKHDRLFWETAAMSTYDPDPSWTLVPNEH